MNIPEDLRELYESLATWDGHLMVSFAESHGVSMPWPYVPEVTVRRILIERIAALETPAPAMNVNDLFSTNLERARRWHAEGIEEWSALEWAGAMAGEAGEAANAAKKLKRLENSIASLNDGERHFTDIESARRAVAKETADVIIYGLLVMARVGIEDPAQIIAEVFNRKSEEYGFPERI